MAPRRDPTVEEADQAVDTLLTVLEAGGDVLDALDAIRPLHPKNNTFPGEVFVRLAALALPRAGSAQTARCPRRIWSTITCPSAGFGVGTTVRSVTP